jgi:hypothetical protein
MTHRQLIQAVYQEYLLLTKGQVEVYSTRHPRKESFTATSATSATPKNSAPQETKKETPPTKKETRGRPLGVKNSLKPPPPEINHTKIKQAIEKLRMKKRGEI